MRFRNYRNSYTKDNRIYSKNEMLDMTVREIKERAEEFIAQHRVLGLPEESELAGSENVIWIDEYTKDDGTKVSGHWRSKPGEGGSGNVNDNHVEQTDWNDSQESFEETVAVQKYEESEEYKREYREREKQKSIERQDPDEIAGVKKGEPKTFLEAARQGVNPNIGDDKKANEEYNNNCTSCSVAFEALQRGYDVEAVSGNLPIIKEGMSWDDSGGFFDIVNERPCKQISINANDISCYDYFDKNIREGERYQLVYYNKGTDTVQGKGHVINIQKDEKGDIIAYDTQDGSGGYGESAKRYLEAVTESPSNLPEYKVLRIDDKAFHPYYRDKVLQSRKKY